ncbi:MAG TPA: 4Fe-4S dicluster domain-containing protein, partial [Gemmatimonadales bacterium]|nr:4Fe-4S dicluster domain-containing protein [Gemmatimonadales bacterium]
MPERPAPLSVSPALDPCVHCGFCLPACPTYLATGEEADSPRGRIVLMRALAQGELAPDDPAVTEHLDHCLGCRGCEPACPSGVEYGRGLEATRAWLAEQNGIPLRARIVLRVFRHRWLWRPLLTAARWARNVGLARALSGKGRIGFSFASLAATRRPGAVPGH